MLIRHLWQLKTVVFLHWFLIIVVLNVIMKSRYAECRYAERRSAVYAHSEMKTFLCDIGFKTLFIEVLESCNSLFKFWPIYQSGSILTALHFLCSLLIGKISSNVCPWKAFPA